MVVGFVITFRETLEAALVIGIVLAYLYRTKNKKFVPAVWWGLGVGLMLSILFAFLFSTLWGGFEGKAEQIFEGITFALAAILITTLVLWLMGHTTVRKQIEKQVSREVDAGRYFGIFGIILVTVLREGVETVIFLGAATIAAKNMLNLALGALGIVAAIAAGYAFFKGTAKLQLRTLFTVTTIILIFFASGIVARSVHEFQEAGVLPGENNKAWDINPQPNSDGSYPLLHDKGIVGDMLKGLFGYNGDPSWLEVIGYAGYLFGIGGTWMYVNSRKKKVVA